MKRRQARKPRRDWTAAWLGGAAALLLALAAAVLVQVHERELQRLRAQAAQTRAQWMAQSIAQHLAQATAAGIPLQRLVGVAEFLERWQGNYPEVTRILVQDAEGKLLWRSQGPGSDRQGQRSAGQADVASAAAPQARVVLELRDRSLERRREILGRLLPAVLLFSALAFLGARFACAQGPWLRNHGLRMIARWVARGDYRQRLVLPQRQPFDLRVQAVAHAMHGRHERVLRLRLLIGSLRRTEPRQLRRDYLDQILQQVEGQDRFADAAPASVRLVAVQSQALWQALLLCLGAVAPLTHALQLAARSLDSRWQPALAAACLGLLLLAAMAGWQLGARLRVAALGVLLLGQAALLLAPLALLLGSEVPPGAIAAWNGLFAGAALAACTRAQTYPDAQPGFAHAQPGVPGAAMLGWCSGLLWLAPALGYYVHAALGPQGAALALLLPMACALCFALRWDTAHSPWRARLAPAAVPAHQPPAHPARPTRSAWRGSALGLAAGLAGGALLAGLVTTTGAETAAPLALMQQCALGLAWALAWTWPSEGAPAARAPQDATSPWLLLGAALGAALSVGAILLGWQAWAPALALLPAWLGVAPARGGHGA